MTALEWLRKDFRGGTLGHDFSVWCIEQKIIQLTSDEFGRPLHAYHDGYHTHHSRNLAKLGKKIRYFWRKRLRKKCQKLGYQFPNSGIMYDWIEENSIEFRLY